MSGKKGLNKEENESKDMAICSVCKQRVTGEKGGGIFFAGKYYHKSCLRKKRKSRTYYLGNGKDKRRITVKFR